MKALVDRLQKLCGKHSYQEEMVSLRNALKQNGFSDKAIRKAFRKNPKNQKQEEERGPEKQKTYLSYVKKTIDRIARILRRHNIDTIFKPHEKIDRIVGNPKTKIPL